MGDRLEVEVARGQQLYGMVFERGHPKGKLQNLGRAPNRRGTKVRFHPDAQIFGAKAAFKPERLFRMARSKAYLFGGVEIRCKRIPDRMRTMPAVARATTEAAPSPSHAPRVRV